jgi:hypothetical protein
MAFNFFFFQKKGDMNTKRNKPQNKMLVAPESDNEWDVSSQSSQLSDTKSISNPREHYMHVG